MSTFPSDLREQVWRANRELLSAGLVVGTSGNVSGRDPGTGLIAIKPSGVSFADLAPEHLVVVDDHGRVVAGELKPSVDTLSHCLVYREREDVHGVVHTHSRYATTFAIRGEDVPVLTTTQAALFGGPIPCSGYAVIGEEEIGREVVRHVGGGSAVLMRSHGVFTIGATVDKALRAAIYTEECAEHAHLALQRGPVAALAPDAVAASRRWYLSDYGQQPVGRGA
ncbi:L-ribulose-5-phosphate 4-epimerase [Actinophytocola sp. NPDC049390]|uniref:L-ribulose-5-phosphate 4-epimerase n=1 Tax=Actinophytocola sp. NPDC049390 TaxID=3363894 RepID=UPI0037BBB0A8